MPPDREPRRGAPILLTGRTGQLGWELQRALSPLGRVLALGRAELDLAEPESVRKAVRDARPRLIVNAGAYTAVDRAEQDADIARRVNAESPRVLAEEASALGIPLVHYSTDYVFDGEKAVPYVESDATRPQSCYGRTKLAGEQAIETCAPQGVIFRTSWVFGEVGGNFVRTILRLASERDALRVVADQVGAPTPAALLADVTAHVIRSLDKDGWPAARVFHVASSHDVSWHAFAQAIVAKSLELGMTLRLRPEAIEAITSAEYPTPAKRPKNSRLDCGALGSTFSLVLPDWAPYLERMLLRDAGGRAR
jgi:dTDP-4-dehydrorhamnose reductase